MQEQQELDEQSLKKPICELSDDERREYDRIAQQKTRDKKRAKADARNQQPRSKQEVSKKDAKDILAERGIQNSHVADVLIDVTETAARTHKLPFNDFLLRHGLRTTLAAIDGQDFEEPEDGEIPGELISRTELYALWDASFPVESPIMFADFLNKRRIAKTDCFLLGRDILGRDFHDTPHKTWSEFFPKFNPDTLPKDYTQEDVKKWLSEQTTGGPDAFLLLASRNCYKSSFSHVYLVSAILNCPDLRCLLVSETQPLAKGFIKAVRGFFEIQSEPTLFNRLFPEYCIASGEGSVLTFQCPAARLGLIQNTAQSCSVDTSTAGQRCDLLLCDDIISNLTTGSEEQTESSKEKFDLLGKLREIGGLSLILGTPWRIGDLYSTLIQRSQEDSGSIAVRVDPAWRVKPEVEKKKLADLEESDVVLLFPERLTWRFLQKERRANERFFRSQNLCEHLPDEDEALKLNFDEDVLRTCLVSPKEVPAGETVFGVDIAFSQSKYADNSCIAVCRIYKNALNEPCMTVLDVLADRYRTSELAIHLAMLTRQHSPRTVLIEKSVSHDLIQAEINRAAIRYEVHIPVWWVPVSNQKNAKFSRLKALEGLLMAGRLKFASGEYVDALFRELSRQDGRKSSSGKKDDRVDAIASIQRIFAPAVGTSATDLEESRKVFAAQKAKAMMDQNYNRIFGGQGIAAPTVEPAPRNYFPTLTGGKAA